MYSYIIGEIKNINIDHITIESNNIGYDMYIPKNIIQNLKINTEVKIFTYMIFKEPLFKIYGFLDEKTKSIFSTLTNISGIGPKTAINILSAFEINKLIHSINEEDVDSLIKVPGLGKKSAQKLILEIKGKIELKQETTSINSKLFNDLSNALISLGYNKNGANQLAKNIIDKNPEIKDISILLTKSLQKHGQ